MAASAIRAGRAFVELFADDKQLVRGLRAASAKLRAFGQSVAAIGAQWLKVGGLMLAPLAAGVAAFTTMGDALDKMALRTGVAVEQLSTLGYAADRSGVPMATLENGLKKMNAQLGQARTGSRSARAAFEQLGLSVDQLAGMSPDEQFRQIAGRIAQIEDPALRAKAAMDLFGESGMELLPLLSAGAEGIEALQARARELGIEMSGEDAAAAAALTDAIADLRDQLKAVFFQLGAAVAPAVKMLADVLAIAGRVAIDFIKRNRGLAMAFAAIAAAIAVVGGALVALGVTAMLAGAGLAALATAAVIAGKIMVLVFSPIGLAVAGVTAAVLGLGYLLVRFSSIGQQAAGAVAQAFGRLWAFFRATLGGIADALAAGEIQLAARILWAALQVIWLRGTQGLVAQWGAMQVVWADLTAGFATVWATTVWQIQRVWQVAASSIAQGIAYLWSLLDRSVDFSSMSAALEARLAAAGRASDQQLAASLAEAQQARRDARGRLAADLVDHEQALQNARREWAEAIEEAAQARAAAARERTGQVQPDFEDLAGDLDKRLAGVFGSFSAEAFAGFQFSRQEDRVARATEQTAENTRRLVDLARNQRGLQFS